MSKDIGEYNTCPHLCWYFYANAFDGVVLTNWGGISHALMPTQLRERDLVNSRHLEGSERKVLIEVSGCPQISAIPSRGLGYEIIYGCKVSNLRNQGNYKKKES